MIDGYVYITKRTVNTGAGTIADGNIQDVVDIMVGGTVKQDLGKDVFSLPVPVTKGSRTTNAPKNYIIDLKRITETITVDGYLKTGTGLDTGISGDTRHAIIKKRDLRYISGATDVDGVYTAGTFYITWKHGTEIQSFQVNTTKITWTEDATLSMAAGECDKIKIMAQFMLGEDR